MFEPGNGVKGDAELRTNTDALGGDQVSQCCKSYTIVVVAVAFWEAREEMEQGVYYVLKLVAEGRISVGRAAELLDQTVYDVHHLAGTYGIELGASDEQRRQSRSLAAELGGGRP